ncbi:MAG: amidohydrolase family protein [Planctomycetes bacterium]|nr:amidohydrolase family protein [Planctomycetota bacterium]
MTADSIRIRPATPKDLDTIVEFNLSLASETEDKTLDGDTWLASHSLTVAEALYAYTVAPAKAIGRHKDLGTIEEGKLADLVVLSDDPFTMPKSQLSMIHVLFTIVDGKIVFESRP